MTVKFFRSRVQNNRTDFTCRYLSVVDKYCSTYEHYRAKMKMGDLPEGTTRVQRCLHFQKCFRYGIGNVFFLIPDPLSLSPPLFVRIQTISRECFFSHSSPFHHLYEHVLHFNWFNSEMALSTFPSLFVSLHNHRHPSSSIEYLRLLGIFMSTPWFTVKTENLHKIIECFIVCIKSSDWTPRE